MHKQIIALLAVVVLAPAGVVRAELSIDVSPVRFELQAEPGAEYTNAVQVQNNGAEPVRLRAYVEDWHLDQDGNAATSSLREPPWLQRLPGFPSPRAISWSSRARPRWFASPCWCRRGRSITAFGPRSSWNRCR